MLTIVLHFAAFTTNPASAQINPPSDTCVPVSDTVTGLPEYPYQYAEFINDGCNSGEKVLMNNLFKSWVRYVIYNVCDLRHSIHVDGFDTRDDDRNYAVVCIKQ